MNSIYTRANPDYSNLINAAIKNRMDFEKQQSKYREGIVKAGQDAIGVIGRGIETWEGMSDEEKELARLKAENEDINNRYSEYLSESNSTGKDYWTNQMQGYKPAGRSIYSDEQTSAYDKIFGGANMDSDQLINEIQNDSTYFYRRDPIHMNPLNRSTGVYRRDPDYNIYEEVGVL